MNILFTVFGGTSAELLLREAGWQGLLLPSDKKKDAQLLISEISSGKYDYIFSFGQKPGIKDKVYIETTARNQGDALETGFDCGRLADALRDVLCKQSSRTMRGHRFAIICIGAGWNISGITVWM